jgi:hypothetical protein
MARGNRREEIFLDVVCVKFSKKEIKVRVEKKG